MQLTLQKLKSLHFEWTNITDGISPCRQHTYESYFCKRFSNLFPYWFSALTFSGQRLIFNYTSTFHKWRQRCQQTTMSDTMEHADECKESSTMFAANEAYKDLLCSLNFLILWPQSFSQGSLKMNFLMFRLECVVLLSKWSSFFLKTNMFKVKTFLQ